MSTFISETDMRSDRSVREAIGRPRRSISYNRQSALRLVAKRQFDILVSVAALIVLLPLFMTIALLIKLDDGGPVIFRQRRWGMNGRIFEVYKFRSMRANLCDPSGVKQTVKGDDRVTAIGAILRRMNFDELPQLFNVLLGDMSLVGPRCHAINMLAAGKLYEELVPEYHQRHSMRPGITGLAQMRGWRGPTERRIDARSRIACDLHYIENFSLWLDIQIIFRTLALEMRGGTGF